LSSTGEEIACQGDQGGVITSGGGFSVYYDRPNWQQIAVTDYFSNLTFVPYPGYNIGGRGYPDVALLGFNYTIVIDGEYVSVSGTSASAPVFAAMVSLINANRLANSSNTNLLGWINPALYEVLANQGQLVLYQIIHYYFTLYYNYRPLYSFYTIHICLVILLRAIISAQQKDLFVALKVCLLPHKPISIST